MWELMKMRITRSKAKTHTYRIAAAARVANVVALTDNKNHYDVMQSYDSLEEILNTDGSRGALWALHNLKI